jgi:hypothetical protein
MLRKRAPAYDENVSLRRRLNADISNLIGSGAVSVARGVQLSHNAVNAGAWEGASSGGGGPVVPAEWQHTRRTNLQRSYRRWSTRNSQWPKDRQVPQLGLLGLPIL